MFKIIVFVPLALLVASEVFPSRSTLNANHVIGNQFVKAFAPNYPEGARSVRAEGRVVVRSVIAKDGTVQASEVLEGSPLLRNAAETAALKWIFARSESESERQVTVVFEFALIPKGTVEIEGVTFVSPTTVIIRRRAIDVEQTVDTRGS